MNTFETILHRARTSNRLTHFVSKQICLELQSDEEMRCKHPQAAMSGWQGAANDQGLPKVSLGPTMPYPSTPCRRPPLKRLHGHFGAGHLQGGRPAAVFYPLGYPTPYATAPTSPSSEAINSAKLAVTHWDPKAAHCRTWPYCMGYPEGG
jgi:hypothetical protein